MKTYRCSYCGTGTLPEGIRVKFSERPQNPKMKYDLKYQIYCGCERGRILRMMGYLKENNCD